MPESPESKPDSSSSDSLALPSPLRTVAAHISPARTSPAHISPAHITRRTAFKLGGAALLTASAPLILAQRGPPGLTLPGLTLPGLKVPGPASGAPDRLLAPPSLALVTLTRLAYGPRGGDWSAWAALSGKSPGDKLRSWLERQLGPAAIDDSACDEKLSGLSTLNKPYGQLWQEHYAGMPQDKKDYEVIYQPTNETRLASILRKTYSERQLLERLTEFWHDHFNVDPGRDEQIPPLFGDYDRILRAGALGNFHALLVKVASHPVMLKYLDNASSSRGGPNENYARELFELHTLGAENYLGVTRQKDVPGFGQGQPVGYVDEDVYEATRAFTGWRMNDNLNNEQWQQGVGKDGTFLMYTPWHDRFRKLVLGRDLPPDQAPRQDGLDVLRALADHPGTARYMARKLVRRLVGDNPPQALVDAAASTFHGARQAPDQIAQTVRVIVLSGEFASTWGGKQKRPLELFVSAARALNTDLKPSFDTTGHVAWMGQEPHGWPAPNGYPDVGAAWRSSTTMLRAWQTMNSFARSDNERWRSSVVKESGGRKRPTDLADFWLMRLYGYKPAALRGVMIEVLSEGGDPDAEISDAGQLEGRLQGAVSFALMAPEFFRK
ncbi:DUF1800 domain-containing protein [Deinococcus sp.]|uniref:DUF1800 domain-containing protein n=1 Tax=Deinococcus sp. TaxID=47478 RepID=UPI0025D34288|nr:DUF1800 domain-containing protein [Deinococcus sp.]